MIGLHLPREGRVLNRQGPLHILGALIALLLAAAGPALAFDLQGHRGARGLYPENTLRGFAAALAAGVSTLELDVGLTRDDVVVVVHDRRLNSDLARGPDGAYVAAPGPAIADLTLAELKRYDVGTIRPGSAYARSFPEQRAVPGTPIPTLAEVAALVRRSGNAEIRFNIEIKLSPLAPNETARPEVFVAAVVDAIRREGIAERSTIQSFDWRALRIARWIAPEIPRAYLTIAQGGGDTIQIGRPGPSPWTDGNDIDAHDGSVPKLVEVAGGRLWSPFFRDLTPIAFTEAKAYGLEVIPWTVNDPADMARLIAMGVDGIITDYPDRLRRVLDEMGLPLPPATPVTH